MKMIDREVIFSNPGNPIKTVYSGKLMEDGSIDLIPVGEENIQEFIDSFAEDTCLPILLQRCATGDLSVLSKVQGMYGDFTEAPKTYRDMLQAVMDGQNAFESLPIDVKEKFDNSFEKWFSTYGSESWLDSMGFVHKDETVQDEVK